jgi:hypothetical protein
MPTMVQGANPQHGARFGYANTPYEDPTAYAQRQQQGKQFEQNLDFQKDQYGARQDAFNKLFPYATSMLGQYGQVGGTAAQQPSITRGPIYTPQQINEQVNAGVAGNDSRYQTLMRQLASSNAGRGFGGSSPAMQAQMTQLGIANIGENARTTRELPMQYAQSNADQVYKTDALAQQQWAQGEDTDIRRRQTQMQGIQGLLAQLSGLL